MNKTGGAGLPSRGMGERCNAFEHMNDHTIVENTINMCILECMMYLVSWQGILSLHVS